MGRPAFTPTEAEAQAMRGAEKIWRSYYEEPDGRQSKRLDLTPLTALKKAVKDLQAALRPFGQGADGCERLLEGLMLQLDLLPGRHDSSEMLGGLNVTLSRLGTVCEQWAPAPGANANTREARFIMQAADVWVVAFNELPTYNGRFHKTIVQVTSPPLCDLTRDRIATGLKTWRQSIASNAFRQSITAGLLPRT